MTQLQLIILAATSLTLAACSTLGSNVSGNWSCDTGKNSGNIADCPTIHEIDEKILRRESMQSVPVAVKSLPKSQITADFSFDDDLSEGNGEQRPTRTADRIGRIVIMPFVDASGIYHDRAVVYAVMEEGEWKSAPQKPILKTPVFRKPVFKQPILKKPVFKKPVSKKNGKK